MKRILREPLLHFLVLGAALFIAFAVMPKAGGGEARKIVISQGQLAALVDGFARTRQRPPTREELEGLIRASVREEVYCREAVALGLDKDDLIIRRRLAQKMEFLSEDIAAQAKPTDADLNAYLQSHPDKFRIEAQFTFRQLYLNPEKHGANLAGDAARLLAKLNQPGGDARFAEMGDPLMLDNAFTAAPTGEIARQFGGEFAAKLAGLKPGRWQGPVQSGFGVHLVFVRERTEGRMPALAEARDAVIREWEDARRQEANEQLYQGLLKHYTVIIEPPPTDVAKKPVASK